MAEIRQRNVAAFESLYDSFHRLVYGIAYRMLNDPMAAEDLTQAVFLKIWSAPESYQTGNFGGWISRVTRNRALDVLRSRSLHSEGELSADVPWDGDLDETVFARLDGQRGAPRWPHFPTINASRSNSAFSAGRPTKRSRRASVRRSVP
jgi:RNA polymerase sigma factor (sigma-70 family)